MSETTNAVPNPGSAEAVSKGCTCPVLDNCKGRGAYDQRGAFWITAGCPVHALPFTPTERPPQ